MTQEEKDLLLRDLCARLPYGITVCDKNNPTSVGKLVSLNMQYKIAAFEVDNQTGELYTCPIEFAIPYLRSMSSMTDEENRGFYCNRASAPNKPFAMTAIDVDWLNAHRFDYRGLIEKGLALEAPEGMYEI